MFYNMHFQKINSHDFISSGYEGIAVPEGACQSGSIKASHVLAEMLSHADLKKPSLRISFSHYNSKEIDLLIEAFKSI
jgi:cysteine desulfurase